MTTPYNVEIHFDDFCKGCKHCNIVVNETERTNSKPQFEILDIYYIRCKNRDVCRMWHEKILEQESEEKE